MPVERVCVREMPTCERGRDELGVRDRRRRPVPFPNVECAELLVYGVGVAWADAHTTLAVFFLGGGALARCWLQPVVLRFGLGHSAMAVLSSAARGCVSASSVQAGEISISESSIHPSPFCQHCTFASRTCGKPHPAMSGRCASVSSDQATFRRRAGGTMRGGERGKRKRSPAPGDAKPAAGDGPVNEGI